MPGRQVENTPTSPYAILGVSRHATTNEIKQAYRKKAKAAHPDAGGSSAAMARVNEAYHTLAEDSARSSYDRVNSGDSSTHRPSTAPPARWPSSKPAPTHSSATAHHTHPTTDHFNYENKPQESEDINRDRRRWARTSAIEMLRFTLPAAIASVLISRYAQNYFTSSQSLLILGFITFLPIYGLILSIIFLVDPPLRLIFADIVRGHSTTQSERTNAVALILGFFPLAIIWALLQLITIPKP